MKRILRKEDISFVALLKTCAKKKDLNYGIRLHSDIQNKRLLEKSPYLASSLISMYGKCGMLGNAREVHDELRVRRLTSWNALIAGYAQQGHGHEALTCLKRMQSECCSPDAVTFSSILKSCSSIGAIAIGKQIHEEILSSGLLKRNVVLGNALVDMYAKCGSLAEAQRVLEELPQRDVVSWSALIAGHAQLGRGQEALNCFERMQSEGISPDAFTFACTLKACSCIGNLTRGEQIHDEIIRRGSLGGNIVLGTALVVMYAKCGMLVKAKTLHDELHDRDVVSWSALIAGYAQHGQEHKALECFEQMQSEGISPNATTFVSILKACGSVGAIDKGKQIHDEIVTRSLLELDILLGNALIGMYAKCGELTKAHQVLEGLCVRDNGSWHALISGYAQYGLGFEAVKCFQQMQDEGLSPNAITLLCVLNACRVMGMLEKARIYFGNTYSQYDDDLDFKNRAFIAATLGCAGHFKKALSILNTMPSSVSLEVWRTMLVACKKWGNVKLGNVAFHRAAQIEKKSTSK